MKSIVLYVYPKCSTCRKASNWLNQNNIIFQLVDIVKEPPKKEFLELALEQFSLNKKKVFNTRGKSFKLIDFNIEKLTNKRLIELLSKDGKLIKRPFLLINESTVITGFSESEYVHNLLKS